MKIKVVKVKVIRPGEVDMELIIPINGSFASIQILEDLLSGYVDNGETGFSFSLKTAEL